jgi:pimeloyl-ACP methyl ester carboxylesterase
MMEYTKTYNKLKFLYKTEEKEILIPDSDIKIYNTGFQSDIPLNELSNKNDNQIIENLLFSYPVFTPPNPESDKVILLLHGLNERSWQKYLSWAYYLAEHTDSYVILFPISFHINRSPASWKDPRAMVPFMKDRNSSLGEINMSSFANVAISNRLTQDPMRFFTSGYQTVADIVKLLLSVRNGNHCIIPRSSNINIFAYSIGAFLAQIILMGNPENLFTESKLFILCGGSVFSNMQGSSKLIMDSIAFDRVYKYYLNDFEKTITGKSPSADFFNSSQIGMAFRSMIDLGRLKAFRENIFKKLRNQIHTVSLLKDTVIPSKGVLATLGCINKGGFTEVWDFPYTYYHENPFPVLDLPNSKKVDYWFEKLFSQATSFLV